MFLKEIETQPAEGMTKIALNKLRGDGGAVGVGPRGLLTAVAPGNATVTASMPNNPHIYATARYVPM